MIQRSTKYLLLLFGIIIIFTGCISSQDIQISELNEKIQLLEQKLNEAVISAEKIGTLEKRLEEAYEEIKDLKENLNVYESYQQLTDLSSFESFKYEQYRQNYNNEVLVELEPLSILKMFLHAKYIGDYETQYELFTKNEEYVLVSKEEFLAEPNDWIPVEENIFEDVYELKIGFSEFNEEHAYIYWKSKNGYIDEKQGAFIYGFALQKDDDIWKVSFNPMN